MRCCSQQLNRLLLPVIQAYTTLALLCQYATLLVLQTIPHYYLTVDCRVDNLMKLRAQLNEALASRDGGKLSVNDFVVKASALVSAHFDHVEVTVSVQCGAAATPC